MHTQASSPQLIQVCSLGLLAAPTSQVPSGERSVGAGVLKSRRGGSHTGDLTQEPVPWVLFGEVSAGGGEEGFEHDPEGFLEALGQLWQGLWPGKE